MLQRSSATLRGFQGEIEPLGQGISVYKLKRQHDDRQQAPCRRMHTEQDTERTQKLVKAQPNANQPS